MTTIDEEGEDQEQDALIAESWYEELVSTKPLEEDLTFEDIMLTPVHMMPEQTVLFSYRDYPTMHGDVQAEHGEVLAETAATHGDVHVAIQDNEDNEETYTVDEDEHGKYIELCFDPEMSKTILDEQQHDSMLPDEIATLRVYGGRSSY